MKNKSNIVLSRDWWDKQKPKGLRAADRAFATALERFAAADRALRQEASSKHASTLKSAIEAVEEAAKQVVSEARALLKTAAPDDKADLDNTIAVLGRPLDNVLDGPRRAAETADAEESPSDFGTEEEHKAYLDRMLPRLKRGTFSFAIAMPSPDPAALRLALHRSKDGRAVANGLKSAGLKGKFAWGIASAERNQDELVEDGGVVEEGGAARTLVLALDSPMVPGLAKRLKGMFGKLRVKSFNKVKLLVEGAVVEEDDQGEEPEDGGPIADESGALHPLWNSLEELKRRVLHLVEPAGLRHGDPVKSSLNGLVAAARDAEAAGTYDKAIGILRDQLIPALRAAARLNAANPGPDADLAVVKPDPSAAAEKRDLISTSLGKVLEKTMGPATSGLLSCFGVGAPTSGKSFFDGVKVTFPDGAAPANEALLREWSINLATMQHLASTVPPDSREYKALMNRAVGYLLKFANIPNTGDLGWQANPTQTSTTGTYHRSGSSSLTEKVTAMTAEKLRVPAENCFLVSDRRVLEEVRRNFASEGELEAPGAWTAADHDRVLRKALAGEEVFIDLSREFRDDVARGDKPQETVERMTAALKAHAFKQAVSGRGQPGLSSDQLDALGTPADRGGMSPAQIAADEQRVAAERALQATIRKDVELATKRLDNIRLGGVMALGEQHALTMFPFSRLSGRGPDTDLTLGGTDQDRLRGLVGHSGLTAGPEQLLDHWVSQTPNVVEILRGLGVTDLPKVEFPKGKTLARFDDLAGDFLQDAKVKKFAALAENDKKGVAPPPYVKVTVQALMGLIGGLQGGEHGASVKSSLEAAGLAAMWSLSLNKIQALMTTAAASKDSMRGFLDNVALIQEELASLISVAQPYTKQNFADGMRQTTKMFPEGFLGDGIAAEFTLKNSASRCFNAVLTACEDVKEQRQGSTGLAKRGLEVLVQADSYYEPSMYVLAHAREHRPTELATGDLQPGGDETEFDRQLQALLAAQKSREDEGKGRAKLDTYLCEFHHNISATRTRYAPEDVTKQVRKLVETGVVANPFTVAIDTTIAKTDDDAIKQFLAAFAPEIKAGTMNVAIYRSAQKFDQLGADTYNGGVMCVVSADSGGQSPFQRALDGKGELPSEQNLQGLAHLNLNAQEQVNQYRAAIMDNTRRMGDPNSGSKAAIPATMLLTPENRDASLLQVAVNDDPEAPFLDIKFPFVPPEPDPKTQKAAWTKWNDDAARYTVLYENMQKLFAAQSASDPEAVVSSTRASFGFQHSNVTLIPPVKLRLNPGLEDETRLKALTDTLVDTNDLLLDLKQGFDAAGRITSDQFEITVADGGLISLPVLDAHRTLKRTLDDRKASDRKKDEARLRMIEALSVKLICANPPQVLRLIEQMSAKFRQDNQASITRCRDLATMTLAIVTGTGEEKQLKQAKAEMAAGRVLAARDRLPAPPNPFAAGTNERTDYDAVDAWVTANAASWDEAAEARVIRAQACRDANDPAGVLGALNDGFAPGFTALRGGTITALRNWATEESSQSNRRIAEHFLTEARARLDQDESEEARPFLREARRMVVRELIGLPVDLLARIEEMERAVNLGTARRFIAESLARALKSVEGGNKQDVKKRVESIDKVIQAAPNLASDDQVAALGKLRAFAAA